MKSCWYLTKGKKKKRENWRAWEKNPTNHGTSEIAPDLLIHRVLGWRQWSVDQKKELLQILVFDISFAMAPKLQWDKYVLLQNTWEKFRSYLQIFHLFSSSPHVGLNIVISAHRSLISNLYHNCSSITDFSKSLQAWRGWQEDDQAMW